MIEIIEDTVEDMQKILESTLDDINGEVIDNVD